MSLACTKILLSEHAEHADHAHSTQRLHPAPVTSTSLLACVAHLPAGARSVTHQSSVTVACPSRLTLQLPPARLPCLGSPFVFLFCLCLSWAPHAPRNGAQYAMHHTLSAGGLLGLTLSAVQASSVADLYTPASSSGLQGMARNKPNAAARRRARAERSLQPSKGVAAW